MLIRWRILLPVLGLLLFSLGSYDSFTHRAFPNGRYIWWSSIRLDSDPLGKRFTEQHTGFCKEGEDGCLVVDPEYIWVDPGWVAKSLVISAAPAFLVGAIVIHGLARLGVSEVASFMISMPVLICAWFFFVGWIIDRRRTKRSSS